MEAQEEFTEEGINYVAMRNLFVREAQEALEVKVEKKTRSKHVRESAERLEVCKTVNPSHYSVPLFCSDEVDAGELASTLNIGICIKYQHPH